MISPHKERQDYFRVFYLISFTFYFELIMYVSSFFATNRFEAITPTASVGDKVQYMSADTYSKAEEEFVKDVQRALGF